MAEPFIGQIVMFGGSFAPRGWAQCDGSLLAISQNQALFSILGTIYGGDGRTDFGLPEMRGRSPVHYGQGPGLNNIAIGARAGVEEISQTPSHSHGAHLRGIDQPANTSEFTSNALANAASNLYFSSRGSNTSFVNLQADSVTVDSAGSSSVAIRNPYQAVNFIIALSRQTRKSSTM